MGEMIVLGYASLDGGGIEREKSSLPLTSPYWRAVDALIKGDVPQPPGAVRNTGQCPIWSLRSRLISGVRHWCFSVQGHGGKRFGGSGACRFGFVSAADTTPAEAWALGRRMVVEDQSASEPAPRDLVANLIAALAQDPMAVPIAAGPEVAAAVIEHALHVVPAEMVADFVWFTCMLQAPTTSARTVAGRLPDEIAAVIPMVNVQVDELMRRGTRGAVRSFSPDALPIVVSWALERKAPPIEGDSPLNTVADLLAAVEMTLDVHEPQVSGLLGSPAGEQRLLRTSQNRDVLRVWARNHPDPALDFVQDRRSGDVVMELFNALIDLQCEQNRRLRPDEGQYSYVGRFDDSRTRDRLIKYLPAYAAGRARPIGAVVQELLVGSGIQPSSEGLEEIRPFLERVGVTAAQSPGLWAPGPARIAAAVRGRKDRDLAAEFAYASDPVGWLVGAIDRQAPFTATAGDAARCTISVLAVPGPERSTAPLFAAFLRARRSESWFSEYVGILRRSSQVTLTLPTDPPPPSALVRMVQPPAVPDAVPPVTPSRDAATRIAVGPSFIGSRGGQVREPVPAGRAPVKASGKVRAERADPKFRRPSSPKNADHDSDGHDQDAGWLRATWQSGLALIQRWQTALWIGVVILLVAAILTTSYLVLFGHHSTAGAATSTPAAGTGKTSASATGDTAGPSLVGTLTLTLHPALAGVYVQPGNKDATGKDDVNDVYSPAANKSLTTSWEDQILGEYRKLTADGNHVDAIVIITYGKHDVLKDRVGFEADLQRACGTSTVVTLGRTDSSIPEDQADTAEVRFFVGKTG